MAAKEKQLWGRFGKIIGMFLICAAVMFAWSAQADADMTIYKLYKKTYSGAKAKCITCHISKVPKKSAFDVNEYGAKLIGEDGKVTVETITAAGEAE